MKKKTVLLAFSGGLDSTTSAIKLRDAGHLVTLGFVDWHISGSHLSMLQAEAAMKVSQFLRLPLLEIAQVRFAQGAKGAKWSWVQAIGAMILWEAAYPIMKYDAVAFGMQVTGCESWQRVEHTRPLIETIAKVVNYSGEIMFPVDNIGRQEQWEALPSELRSLVWCCNIPTKDGKPCGSCYKCKHDKLWKHQS